MERNSLLDSLESRAKQWSVTSGRIGERESPTPVAAAMLGWLGWLGCQAEGCFVVSRAPLTNNVAFGL